MALTDSDRIQLEHPPLAILDEPARDKIGWRVHFRTTEASNKDFYDGYSANAAVDINYEEQEGLCGYCKSISLENPGPDRKEDPFNDGVVERSLTHHTTVSELEKSGEKGCPICQSLWVHLTYQEFWGWTGSEYLEWTIKRRGKHQSYGFICWKADKYRNDSIELWNPNAGQLPHDITDLGPVRAMTEVSWKKDLETICRDDIFPWLRHCIGCFDNHSECSSPLSWKENSLPTRLIDVGTEEDHDLRLINTSSELSKQDAETSPYLILSYCWGNSNDSAKTTRSNVKNRADHINANDLPRTIQDAIAVTRSMGVRYLCVDAICIIQSEPGELDPDWDYESRRMTVYYSNALCCIAASCAKESSHGFLKERVIAKFPLKTRRLPGGFYLTLPDGLRTGVPNWLLERAWCLQESILSPRILHWTEYGLILQCRAGLVREGQSEPVATFPFRYSGQGFARTRENQILHSARELALSEDWIDLIQQYSRMRLTCPEDRLIAIDGVARFLSEKHDEDYFAGIFRSTCHLTLLWWGIGPGPCKNEFPTWSWASTKWIFFNFAGLLEPKSLIRSLGPFPATNKTSNYRNRQARQLDIEAPFISTVGCEQTKKYPYDIWRFGTGSPASQHDECEINFDDGPGRIDALFVLSRFSSARWRYQQLNYVPVVYQGIMLQRSERDGENAFTRVGHFSVDVRPRESGYLDSFVTKINLF